MGLEPRPVHPLGHTSRSSIRNKHHGWDVEQRTCVELLALVGDDGFILKVQWVEFSPAFGRSRRTSTPTSVGPPVPQNVPPL
jgi:hypothetical protein